MTEATKIGSRGAVLVLAVSGLLTLLMSFGTWGWCPTTPCGGFLMAISEYSGLDLGFGVVTALAGLALAAIGLDGFRRKGVSRFAAAAVLLALAIVVTAGASVIWMYVIPGDDKEFHWPPFTAILVGIIGLIAFVASLWLRRTIPRPGG
jgi:peptidoglycan/LPS O-acetylase OafA/YrhL